MAVGDRMFLGMQDFDFLPKPNQILPKFYAIYPHLTKFYPHLPKIYPNKLPKFYPSWPKFFSNLPKKLLGDAAASLAFPAPTSLIMRNSKFFEKL